MATRKQKVEMFKLTCEVCGHKWMSAQKPLRCSKCKTPYWDRPRVMAPRVVTDAKAAE